MRSINLDHLRTLVEVVERGGFSAAARQLNMTQPAISLHIRALEERFGVSLLDRSGKVVSPSAPGAELITHAIAILDECDRAANAMRRYKDGWLGRVSIVTTLTNLNYRLPPVLKHLRRKHPQIELIVTNMTTRDAVDRVARREADFGLITLPTPEARLRVTRLCAEELVAIYPPGSDEIPSVVTPAQVADASLILEHTRGAVGGLIEQWLARANVFARPAMRIATVEAIKTLVAAGLGMSIVPAAAMASGDVEFVTRPLQPPIEVSVGLVEHPDRARGGALDIVRDALLQIGQPANDVRT